MTEQEFKTALAENLISYRKLNHFTQMELAQCINYSDKSVSKWERAESMPDIYVLSLIAAVYGVTVSELIGETEPDRATKDARRELEKDMKEQRKMKAKALERAQKQTQELERARKKAEAKAAEEEKARQKAAAKAKEAEEKARLKAEAKKNSSK